MAELGESPARPMSAIEIRITSRRLGAIRRFTISEPLPFDSVAVELRRVS
jgi:hypothetical protein